MSYDEAKSGDIQMLLQQMQGIVQNVILAMPINEEGKKKSK